MGLFSRIFKSNKKSESKPEERTVLTLEVGDIVVYDLQDYEVVGKITYRDGNFEWFGYQLLVGHDTIWLSAEMDDELELGVYRKIQLPVSKPYPKKITHEGKAYHLEESGRARVTGEGRSANLQGGEVEYADYAGSDEADSLSLEAWGNEIEASIGHPIEPYEIKIIAGSI